MVSSELWFGASPSFYNGVATQSLRLDDGSSAFLSRTPAGASTNLKAFTFSTWVKRSSVSGATHTLFSAGANSNDVTMIRFEGNGITDTQLSFFNYTSGSLTTTLKTKAKFRDSSAWYNIIVACDTTQSGANKAKIYVNGVLVDDWHDSSHDEYPNDDSTFQFGNNVAHRIGSLSYSTTQLFDGYMAETNFIAESQVAYTEFGELKNGVWIPKQYLGSYGGNGFRLQFEDNAVGTPENEGVVEDDNIGRDSSGEHNHFTSSGIVASDCNMPDSPENNFCTMNSIANGRGNASSFSEGNLKIASTYSAYSFNTSTFRVSSGKWYWEMMANDANAKHCIGISGHESINTTSALGDSSTEEYSYTAIGQIRATSASSGHATYGNSDIIGVALNLEDNELQFFKNGSSITTISITAPSGTTDGGYGLAYGDFASDNTGTATLNCGQDPSFAGVLTGGNVGTETPSEGAGVFKYAPPSGYLALCTANLPETTISPNALTQADDHFGTLTYTGDGNSTQNIRSGASGIGGEIDFKPDFTWTKGRIVANSHLLYDSSRGAGASKGLKANDVAVEGENDNSTYGYLSSFETNGFNVVKGSTSDHSFMNQNNKTLVAWNWKANGGTTSTIAVDSVSSGVPSIASTVQANTDAGFSIVTYTGNDASSATFGHGLGSVPAMVIIKSRDSSSDWAVYHKKADPTAPEDFNFRLNKGTVNRENSANFWNDTTPTSSVFTIGTSNVVNNTDNFIAYCFAEIEGYSKFGSYTGNGDADGTFVFTGFRPAFLIVKRRDGSANNWVINDAIRTPNNEITGSSSTLYADTSNTESDLDTNVDFLSNGFKARTTGAHRNTSSTYIYMAFAEVPFKYANAR